MPKSVQFIPKNPITNEPVQLKTLETDPHKFLGAVVTNYNTAKDRLQFLLEKLETKLSNLDSSCVRAEYKVTIHTRYVLPAMRYHLTLHSLQQTHLDQQDMTAQKYLKKWLGIPSQGCTSSGVFSPYLLGVKPVSQVYLEGHLGAYINSQLVADVDTVEAIRCAEQRQGQWVKKSSTLLQCRDLMEEIKEDELCFIPSKENTSTFEATVRIELPKIKKVASQKVSQVFRKRAEEEATRIPFQGAMLSLLAQEREDISWRAVIH